MSRELDLRALAKINLDLRVLHRRGDGYHEIRTVFQTISLADRIRIRYEPSRDFEIQIDGNVAIEDNLIARAARAVTQELGCGGVFHFRLSKRIPMGAGLGGGSSDAAAVLLALPALLERAIAPDRLHALAAAMGSDVPFFLYGGTALGMGRGDELYPLPDARALPGLLVAPSLHVSTPEAYRALRFSGQETEVAAKRAGFARFTWTRDPAWAENDFEPAVFGLHPELSAIRATLERNGAICARMTGSGSSIFGLFASPEAARQTRAAFPEHRTFPFAMVSRRRYRDLWDRQTTSPAAPE